MEKRTINDEIIDIFNSEIEKLAFPTECIITKVYENNYADVKTDLFGEITYLKVFGDYSLGDKALLLFLNNDYNSRVVITGANNSDVTTLIAIITDLINNFKYKVNDAIYGEKHPKASKNKFNFAIIEKSDSYIDYEELWILSNAYYDYDAKRFVKIDETHASFGIQIQANGSYPGEADLGYMDNVGINIWRNPIKADAYRDTENFDYSDFEDKNYLGARRLVDDVWVEFGIASGWSNSFMVDSYGGMTIGGAGFEVDGNGIYPYTRLTSSAYTDENDEVYYLLGLLDNAYHPTIFGWDSDSNSHYSWFVGFKTPSRAYMTKKSEDTKFVVMYNDTQYNEDNTHELDVSKWKSIFEIDIHSFSLFIDGELKDIMDYDSLKNKPTIPTNLSELNNDMGFLTSHQDLSDYITNSILSSILSDYVTLTEANANYASSTHTHEGLSDSGWIDLNLTGNFYNFDSTNKVQYRKVGKNVQILGLPVLNAYPSALMELTIGTLPSEFRPTRDVSYVCELKDDTKLWTCTVKSTGDVTFNRLRDNAGFVAGTAFSDVLKLNVNFLSN